MLSGLSEIIFCLLIFVFGVTAADAEEYDYSAQIDSVMVLAGDNRVELEKVLEHYDSSGDTLEYNAARFLIANMEGHCYATYALKDSLENEYELDILEYPDFETLLAELDTLEQTHGELNFARGELYYDVESITADFLIKHIDYAFRAWRERPWAKGLSYELFREYVLPYRGSNEPLDDWRPHFWAKYDGIDSLMTDPADPIDAASIINDDIISWFKFDRRYYLHPTDQGLTEMLETKMGRCEDMTNLCIFAMRANGLAVTSDFTPYWANAGNNHAWNSIVTPGGEVLPFMGAERNPREYKLQYKAAKVYRKMFGLQKDNLVFQERKQEKVPGWLGGKSYIDVTAAYVDVIDLAVGLDCEIPDSVDIAYICVFNDGGWRAIHWSRINDGSALFRDMGADVAYIPALYINEEIEPCGHPVLVEADGTTVVLRADSNTPVSLSLTSTTKVKRDTSTDGVDKSFLTAGTEYELFYWSGGWQSVGKITAGDGPLVFDNVPGNALYWLSADGSDDDERIFTFSDGQQVWW